MGPGQAPPATGLAGWARWAGVGRIVLGVGAGAGRPRAQRSQGSRSYCSSATDGSIGLPPTRIVAAGTAITLPQLDVPELPRRASVVLDVTLEQSERPMFIGVGPSAMVDAYLRNAPIDVIEQIDWPGAARTTPIDGSATPAPPGGRPSGWPPRAVAHRTCAGMPHRVTGRWSSWPSNRCRPSTSRSPGAVTISILGPIGIGVLVVAIALLASGIWVTARAAAHAASPRSTARRRPLADLLRRLVEPIGARAAGIEHDHRHRRAHDDGAAAGSPLGERSPRRAAPTPARP